MTQTQYETPSIVNTLSVQNPENKAKTLRTLKVNKSSFLQIEIGKNCRNKAKSVTVTHTLFFLLLSDQDSLYQPSLISQQLRQSKTVI